jgi:quinol monooxygenase YgiN
MAGVVHIPWYATVMRGDKLAEALAELAPVAIRYGALDYELYRSKEDTYKFLQTATFESKLDFERYWNGPEFEEVRRRCSSYYQVPLVYAWHERLARGSLGSAQDADAA